ncbi:CHAT domain-containing protein [Roseospira goensis]|uniref:CHAT domain-containing protein n=1 Tax=Roseospira goensis TaxID=391922 RepID=A0A7W6RXD2_9PROT|nr:CHAT domain-containing protein [Roseospira goensis]
MIAPLLDHLAAVDTLFIAPDGPLHAVPFGALTDDRDRRLLERFAGVRLLQTGRDLVARERPATGTGLVALGGVDFGPPPDTEPAAAAPATDGDAVPLTGLSACNTGQGVFDDSEGLEGLPRAFYVAGAKAVLVALWPIGDAATATFMARFYETWLADPTLSPAAALQRTKRVHDIGSANPAARDPAVWAPFVLYEG